MSDATMTAPPTAAAAAEPATTPGPKEFSPSSGGRSHASLRDALEAHATPDPNRQRKPEPVSQAALPTPPKKEDKPVEAKVEDKPEGKKADAKGDKLPVGRPPTTKAQETWANLKERARVAEARVKEYETQRVPEQERTSITQRMEQIQKRNDELENHIRFTNYEQSTEFKAKYQDPYESRLADAITELSQIPVTGIDGNVRAATQDDLFELINLDPVKRLAVAKEKFGDLAQEVIDHAKDVRNLLITRNKALDEAKVKGKERETQQSELMTRQMKAFEGKVREWYYAAEAEWNKDPDAKLFDTITREDGKELTPEETEHNKLVEKGKALSAWVSKHPKDAKTPEEAAEIVRKQYAILKRAIHFAPLRRLYKAVVKERDALKKENDQYRGTTPTTAGRITNGHAATAAKSGVKGMFDKYAGR
jgi:hypothetical protein